jgi:heat shock protein HslJ
MACADARLNAQETDFLATLQATNRYEIEHDTLVLARDGAQLARLASAPQ